MNEAKLKVVSRKSKAFTTYRALSLLAMLLFCGTALRAQIPGADLPPRPSPPHLVNDLADVIAPLDEEELEAKLLNYERTSSTQIAVVTVRSIGGHDVAQYGTELFKKWQIGQRGKDNGVLIIASTDDRKVNITTGRGLEGALPDITAGKIIRNEMVPEFRTDSTSGAYGGRYYRGFSKAADAIIAATKGEYTAEDRAPAGDDGGGIGILPIIVLAVIVIAFISRRGGGGGGGGYMSRRGYRGWGGPVFLPGGFGGGWGGGGGGFGGGGGGGFGGFGGGDTAGGGASGSW